MSADERLLYESRVRMRQALLAGVTALLLIVGSLLQVLGPTAKVSEATLGLITVNKRVPLDQIGSAVTMLGLLGLAGTLAYLFGAARARRPEMREYTKYAAIAGAILMGVATLAYWVIIAFKAHQFVTQGDQTYVQANHLTKGFVDVIPLLAQLGAFLLAIGFFLISMNAMRVGLITRLMGYLGIFAAVLFVIPFTPLPIVQAGWLIAIAYLISGRWPSGVPPAWLSGRAEPWPSGQQVREQRIRANDKGKRATPAPALEPAGEPVGAQAARTRSATPKRKRKRRR
jgi:hypothetical protein